MTTSTKVADFQMTIYLFQQVWKVQIYRHRNNDRTTREKHIPHTQTKNNE